jgi:transcriptional regulator with XRE-family HTH domain
MSLGSIDLNIDEKFKDADYKAAFLEARLVDEVAHNLRLIREQQNMRQSELAERSGTKQAAISRIERSEQANWNIKTLFRLALALDYRLKIVFQPMEEALREFWPALESKATKPTMPYGKGGWWQVAEEPSGPKSVQDLIMGCLHSNRASSLSLELGIRRPSKYSNSVLTTLGQ